MAHKIAEIAADSGLVSMSGKKWYTSKTIWTNLIAAVALLSQKYLGYVIDPSYQVLILSGVNLVLRKISNEPVIW